MTTTTSSRANLKEEDNNMREKKILNCLSNPRPRSGRDAASRLSRMPEPFAG